jgi:hypothetical protein
MFTTTDSMVVNTEDAQLQFALMQTKRMGAVEDATTALTAMQEDVEKS